MEVKRLIAMNTRHFADGRKNNRGYAETLSGEQLDELLRQEWLKKEVEAIRSGNEKRKDWLPFICPHYTAFKDNHRAQDSIIPEAFTFMTCVDVDDASMVSRAFEKAMEVNGNEQSEWHGQVLRMAYSARRKGHIYIRIPKGMTIEETQRAFCKEIGVPYDESCITPERFIYVTGMDEEIYRSEHWLEPITGQELEDRREAYRERGMREDGSQPQRPTHLRTLPLAPPYREGSDYLQKAEEADMQEVQGSGDTLGSKVSAPRPLGRGGGRVRGVRRFLFIFDACMKEAELSPEVLIVKGHRHEALKSILSVGATQLLRKEELMEVLRVRMPNNWQDENIRKLVDDFYTKYYDESQKLNAFQRRTLARSLKVEDTLATTDGHDDEEAEEAEKNASDDFMLPSQMKLPLGLKESLTGVPKGIQMPVLCAVMPIAAAYADQVEVEYCDGKRMRLGLMSIIRGEQASGKSVCKNVVDVWKRQLYDEDVLARQREDAWKERKNGKKANEKAPEDPKVLIRIVPVTISCSTLLKRLKYANGHCLYSFGEELDTLRKTNGAGSWSSKYDIYRLAFDNGEWGQDYNSDQAESGMVDVAYNWTVLGTNGAMRKCFKQDNIENGLSSRILVAAMPDSSFAKMPKFGKRSAEDDARINEAVTKLRSYGGYIDTPRLRRAIDQWAEEKRVEAAKDIDRVKDTYRKRAAVIGFRCGVVYRLLEGKESNKCLRFATAMAEYCLREQIAAFGEALGKEYMEASEECQRYGVNHSVFDRLPPVFSMDDLKALKGNFCTDSGMRTIISRWRCDGWIDKIDKRHWEKKKKDEPQP